MAEFLGQKDHGLSKLIETINKGDSFRVIPKNDYDKFLEFQKSSFAASTPVVGRGRGSLFNLDKDETFVKQPYSPSIVSSGARAKQPMNVQFEQPNISTLGQVYVPKLPLFSGSSEVPKGEVSFDVWEFEVKCLLNDSHLPESVLFQSIRNSLKGQARSMLMSIGEHARPVDIVNKLDGFYGNVESGEDLMQSFYNDCQKTSESIVSFGVRLEEVLSRAVNKGHIDIVAKDTMLRNKLWTGLRNKDLKRTTHHLYNNIKDFQSLLREIRKVEQQELTSIDSSSSTKPKVAQQHSGQVDTSSKVTSNSEVMGQLQELMNRMKVLETKMDSSLASNSSSDVTNQNHGSGRGRGSYNGRNRGYGRSGSNNGYDREAYYNRGYSSGYSRGNGRGNGRGNNRDSSFGRGSEPVNSQSGHLRLN